MFNLNSIAAYQVSEMGMDTLIIEGWKGATKKYTRMLSNIIIWQTLALNYKEINKVVIKSGNTINSGTFDYNFDNISLDVEHPFFKV